MPSRREQSRYLSTLVSPNPDLTEDRVAALEMIEKYKKEPHAATPEDIRWFWKDMDSDDPDNYALAKEAVAKDERFIKWNEQYPFELTEWLREWYTYMPEALSLKLDGAGPVDWNLLFTLIEPLNTCGVPFICLRKALNVRQNQLVREQIYKEVTEDPKLRDRVLNYQPISPIYTQYTPYGTIHKEVMRRLKPDSGRAPRGSIAIFKEVEKLIREGRVPEEAFREVMDSEYSSAA